MTRLRRLRLAVLVGVLVTLPTAASAFASNTETVDSDHPRSSVVMTATLQ